MAKGKYSARKSAALKQTAVILVLVLVLFSSVGGTIAWMISRADEVVNTFTIGEIELKLDEALLDADGNPVDADGDGVTDRTEQGNEYGMVPGKDIAKDPIVTVKEDSESCWLFVTLEKSEPFTYDGATYSFDHYLEYALADGWEPLPKLEEDPTTGKLVIARDENDEILYEENVYFRRVESDPKEQKFSVLDGDKVFTKSTVTRAMLNALDEGGRDANGDGKPDVTHYPTLAITAYAVQYAGFEPAKLPASATDEEIQEASGFAAATAWQLIIPDVNG